MLRSSLSLNELSFLAIVQDTPVKPRFRELLEAMMASLSKETIDRRCWVFET
jgi:hypothetical protein